MRLLDRYLLSSVPRSPDDPAAPEAEVAEAVADVVGDPPAADPAPADPPEPQPEPVAETAPKWMIGRLHEETNRRQEAERATRSAVERAQNLEEIVRRMQAQGTDPAKPAEPARVEAPRQPGGPDPAAVQAARQQLMLETVIGAGMQQFGPKWDEAVKALELFDANTIDFVSGVFEVDPQKTHEILFNIAQDGERAVALARMSPTKRIAEITRMVMAQAAPKEPAKPAEPPKAPISRAPAPKPVLAPVAAAPEIDPRTPEGNEKMSSDKDWERWFKEEGYKTLFKLRA